MDMFSTRTMLQMVNEGEKKYTSWLRDRYFKDRPTFATARVDFDIRGIGNRKIAPFVNPRIGGKNVDRQGYKTLSFEAPEVSPQMVTTAEDMLLRAPGESLYSQKTPAQRAAEQLGQDLSDLDDIITGREEAMCAEALFTGQITVKGDGYNDVIKYWSQLVSGEQPKTTLGTKWTDASIEATDILADIRQIRRTMMQTGGFTPRDLILGSDVVDAVVDKLANSKSLDNRRVDLGHIDPNNLPEGVTYWGYLKDSAVDIYSYDSTYVDDQGTTQNFVPKNLCLLASPNAKTVLAYGVVGIVNEQADSNKIMFVEGNRVPISWVQRANPSGRIVQIKSRPLPIIKTILGFHVIANAV